MEKMDVLIEKRFSMFPVLHEDENFCKHAKKM